jgi:hypothetical protein
VVWNAFERRHGWEWGERGDKGACAWGESGGRNVECKAAENVTGARFLGERDAPPGDRPRACETNEVKPNLFTSHIRYEAV